MLDSLPLPTDPFGGEYFAPTDRQIAQFLSRAGLTCSAWIALPRGQKIALAQGQSNQISQFVNSVDIHCIKQAVPMFQPRPMNVPVPRPAGATAIEFNSLGQPYGQFQPGIAAFAQPIGPSIGQFQPGIAAFAQPIYGQSIGGGGGYAYNPFVQSIGGGGGYGNPFYVRSFSDRVFGF